MAETNNLRTPEHLLIQEQSALPPRLVSSGSSWQLQEGRGGFPIDVKAEERRDTDTSSDDRGGVSVRDLSAFQNDGATDSRSLAN